MAKRLATDVDDILLYLTVYCGHIVLLTVGVY